MTIKDIKQKGIDVEKYYFEYKSNGTNSLKNILNQPRYIYAKINNFDMPVDKVYITSIENQIKKPVIVNGNIFYDFFNITLLQASYLLKIGKSITYNSETKIVNFSLSGNLLERIRDVEFIIALLKHEQVYINNSLFTISSDENELIEYTQILKNYTSVRNLFEILNIKEQLNFDNLKDNDIYNINILIDSILNNKNIKFKDDMFEEFNIIQIDISNLKIALILTKINNECKITNYFNDTNNLYNINYDINGKEIPCSIYMILNKNDFLTVSNINYLIIYDSIFNLPLSNEYISQIPFLLLEMIKAYDVSKDDELYQCSLKISDKLLQIEKNPINFINKMQIIKRKRSFNSDEIENIFQIRQRNTDDSILACVSILLESFIDARMFYNKLEQEIREVFDEYPINYLWSNKNNQVCS